MTILISQRLEAFGVIYCPVLEGVLRVTNKVNYDLYANMCFRKGRPALSDPGGIGKQS